MIVDDRTSLPRHERVMLAALAVISLALRAIAYFHYRFDSDEPQHLHVAWGWTAGLLQYRDYFDNHAPLFHMLTAPLLAALGERSDILLFMRAPMLLLFAVVLACTWIVAKRFYSTRVALWSVVLLSLLPPFFLKSLEYRTDNLWNAVWMVALVAITSVPLWFSKNAANHRDTEFAIGLLMGIGLSVSLKTSLLVASCAFAAVVTAFAFRERLQWPRLGVNLVTFAVGFAMVPAAIVGYFASRGALDRMVYCVIEFNELVAQTKPHSIVWRIAWPFLMAAIVLVARRAATQREQPDDPSRWRFYLAVLAAVFFATLVCFWTLISPRDYLPMMPLMVIFVVAWVDRLSAGRRVLAMAAVALAFAAVIVYIADGLRNHTREHITMMDQVLGLSHPGEPLMDYKGETIYRQRPFYFIFENITRRAMQANLIQDTVADDVVRARCYVAQADGDFWPGRSKQFLLVNFLDLGRLRAAGQWVRADGSFRIAIPGEYVVLNERGIAAGQLDGSAQSGARLLGAGDHQFNSAREERLAVLWAPAYQRGYSPFHLRDRDF